MSAELRELYQEVIIDHGRHPRNFGAFDDANLHKEGFNPLCGDKILLHVEEKNGVLKKIQFEGSGCAISMASASLLSEILRDKTVEEAEELFTAFHDLVTEGILSEKLGKLTVLSGVREFPARVKCATLAWHTLKAAIHDDKKEVTTEETS
ncbi:MAG TPA: SUF system NifU family Fe-S cluster assembly protein [Gammaproteobacteria bacterium]|nr:SUF system NifU family Fe-S cluster assembly protein [Gammaproteobacteria bacterium]